MALTRVRRLSPDQIARRGQSCWCEACFGARGRSNMTSSGNKLICPGCMHRDKPEWVQQTARDLGTGLAGRRKVRPPCVAPRLPRARPLPLAPLTVQCPAPAASQEARVPLLELLRSLSPRETALCAYRGGTDPHEPRLLEASSPGALMGPRRH